MTERLLSTTSPRLFTVATANKTLPLVSAIVADLSPLWSELNSTRNRIQYLVGVRGIELGNPYSDELSAIQKSLVRESQRVEGLIDELRKLGVEFKGAAGGHACFPAMLEGRNVYLSWQLGESEVTHWMDLDEELVERKSLLTKVSSAD